MPLPLMQVICYHKKSAVFERDKEKVINYIVAVEVVSPWLDRDTVVATLIHEVGKVNVPSIHRIKPVGILHPVVTRWRLGTGSIDIDVLRHDIGRIHHVNGP